MPELPDRLERGAKLRSGSGHIYIVHTTSKRDEFDEPLYKLESERGLVSSTLWSRDKLQEAGAVLLEGEDDGR